MILNDIELLDISQAYALDLVTQVLPGVKVENCTAYTANGGKTGKEVCPIADSVLYVGRLINNDDAATEYKLFDGTACTLEKNAVNPSLLIGGFEAGKTTDVVFSGWRLQVTKAPVNPTSAKPKIYYAARGFDLYVIKPFTDDEYDLVYQFGYINEDVKLVVQDTDSHITKEFILPKGIQSGSLNFGGGIQTAMYSLESLTGVVLQADVSLYEDFTGLPVDGVDDDGTNWLFTFTAGWGVAPDNAPLDMAAFDGTTFDSLSDFTFVSGVTYSVPMADVAGHTFCAFWRPSKTYHWDDDPDIYYVSDCVAYIGMSDIEL